MQVSSRPEVAQILFASYLPQAVCLRQSQTDLFKEPGLGFDVMCSCVGERRTMLQSRSSTPLHDNARTLAHSDGTNSEAGSKTSSNEDRRPSKADACASHGNSDCAYLLTD